MNSLIQNTELLNWGRILIETFVKARKCTFCENFSTLLDGYISYQFKKILLKFENSSFNHNMWNTRKNVRMLNFSLQ